MAILRTGQGSEEETQFEIPGLSPPEHAGAIGQLNGYELQSIIGCGAMGVVYRAWEADLSRPVAIKFMAPRQALDATARERFLREARSAAAVKHAHIVTIHKVGEHANIPYIVMEFVEGESLYELIHRERPLPAVRILDLARQICLGLAAAHDAGIIHRDIKPSNVLVERATGHVKIVDFGLARPLASMDDLTLHGQMLGTPSFMSPEQARGQAVDARSDLFSLGCVLYALIAGQSPFQGSTAIDSVRKVIDHPVPPLPLTPLPLPGEFLEIVTRLLSKSPADRFTSAREVLKSLDQISAMSAAEATVIASPVSKRATGPSWWTIVAAALLVAAGVGGALWQQSHQGSRNASLVSVASVSPTPHNESTEARAEITVSTTAPAQYRDLEVALQNAGPGTRIRVLDDATYRVHLRFGDSVRLRGVTLESPRRALLASRDGNTPVLEFVGGRDITIGGFKIEAPAQVNAILLSGDTSGVILEDLEIDQVANGAVAAIHVACASATFGGSPNQIRRCDIRATEKSQCLWIHGDPEPASPLIVEHNTLSAEETLLVVWGRCQDTKIRWNVLKGGANAINLNLPTGTADDVSPIIIQNNTFFRNTFWLGFVSTVPNYVQADIRNNLIVQSGAMEGSESQLLDAASSWVISHNLWQPASDVTERPAIWSRYATIVESLPLHSLQSESQDFLVPLLGADGPNLGAGGDLPLYIGAYAPK